MGQPIRVLHVDDEPEFGSLVADLLEREGEDIAVETETEPDRALARAVDEPFDAIVSDYDMPDTDGIELFRSIREAGVEVPFILFTGKGSEEVASEALGAGLTDYLQKRPGTDQYSLLANRIHRAVSRHRTEAALVETRRMQSTLLSNLPGMVYRCANEPSWPMTFVSEGAEALTGYAPEAIENDAVLWGEDVIHEDDQGTLWDDVQAALERTEPFELTYRIETADGETKWVWEQGEGVFEDGELVALEGFITDVTEQRATERRLRDRERELADERDRYSALFENTGDCIAHTAHPDGVARVVDVNPAFVETFGYEREAILGEPLDEFVVPEDRLDEGESINQRAFGGELVEVEVRRLTADGPRDFLLRSVPLGRGRDETYAVYTDISERKRTERRYQALIENSADILTVLDADGTVLYESPSIERILGWPQHALIGECAFDYIHPDDRAAAMEKFEGVIEDPRADAKVRFRFEGSEGDWHVLEAQGTNRLDDPAVEGLIINSRDVTDRARQREAMERQNERLQEFASVLSHDVRSPLSVAQGRADLLAETGDREHHDELTTALDRIETIVEDLLEMASRGGHLPEAEPVELAECAREAWRTVQTDDAHLEIVLEGTVEADPGRLTQLFENLFRNAAEHGGDGVTVTVTRLEDGFAVTDDGVGIPAEERDLVLESGHTGTEDGTGFGLAIVEQVAAAHDWEVRVCEGDAGGAQFEFRGVAWA